MHNLLPLLVLTNTTLLLALLALLLRGRQPRPTIQNRLDHLHTGLREVRQRLDQIQESINKEAAYLRELAGDSAIHTREIAGLNVAILKVLRDGPDPSDRKARLARQSQRPDIRRVQ